MTNMRPFLPRASPESRVNSPLWFMAHDGRAPRCDNFNVGEGSKAAIIFFSSIKKNNCDNFNVGEGSKAAIIFF